MAYEIPGFTLGVLPANISFADEDAYQFTAVNVVAATATDGTDGAAIDTPAASGDASIGILQNNPILGEAGTVMVAGVSKAQIQGSVSIGDKLMSVPGGKLALATSGKYQIAQALEAGEGSDGDVIAVLLVRNGKA